MSPDNSTERHVVIHLVRGEGTEHDHRRLHATWIEVDRVLRMAEQVPLDTTIFVDSHRYRILSCRRVESLAIVHVDREH